MYRIIFFVMKIGQKSQKSDSNPYFKVKKADFALENTYIKSKFYLNHFLTYSNPSIADLGKDLSSFLWQVGFVNLS